MSGKPMTIREFEEFYNAEYSTLIKFLVFLDAPIQDAEDAAQNAMIDLYRRLKEDTSRIINPTPWIRTAAAHYFVKMRQRDRERLRREIKGGHLTIEAYIDDGLTSWEDDQLIQQLLGELTPTQKIVLGMVLEGMSTREIADNLGKREENIRQQLKNSRNRLKLHSVIISLAGQKNAVGTKFLAKVSVAPEGRTQ